MGQRQYSKEDENELRTIFDARPESEDWPKVGPWLTKHAKVIELTREAAAKPRMGFIFGKDGSIRDQEVVTAADEHQMAMILTGMRHFRH